MAYYNYHNRQNLPNYKSTIYPINPIPSTSQEAFASNHMPIEQSHGRSDDEEDITYEKPMHQPPTNNNIFQHPYRPKENHPRWWR